MRRLTVAVLLLAAAATVDRPLSPLPAVTAGSISIEGSAHAAAASEIGEPFEVR